MDKILTVFTLLAEMLMVWQCLQIVFGKKIKIDKYAVGMALIDIVIYTLINQGMIPVFCSVLLYLLIFLFCYYKFKQNIVQTIIRLIVGFALIGCVESAAAFLTNFFRNADNSMLILFLSSMLALILASAIKWVSRWLAKIVIERGSAWRFGIIIVYGVLFVGLVVDYYVNQNLISIYVVLALSFLIFIFLNLYGLENTHNELVKKNYELEVQKVYGKNYERLLQEVRKRQHDYKNQLSAIYGMHLTAQSLDELINMQKEYGEDLQSACKFDSILTCCENQILAGFLYYKCVSCENENIIVDYTIHIEQAKCRFALHEIIEILGIFIDNACENVKMESSLEKRIRLEFQEDAEKLTFSVSNPAGYISFAELDKMFVNGYSSKGEDRGIGLTRVSELAAKYDAEIRVYNSAPHDKENWICFVIEIRK